MQVKTEQRKIPAYATRSTSKGWLWSVWLDKQSSVRRFQTQSPSFSGFAQNKAEAIECCSQKLGINLMEAKIYRNRRKTLRLQARDIRRVGGGTKPTKHQVVD